MSKAVLVAAAFIMLALSGPVAARPYRVDDLLRTEDFGAIAFDPAGRWLVFERLEPFVAMSRFDMLARASVLRARLYRVDLHASWRAVPVLADPRPGTISYGFSTGGHRLAIGRLSGDQWQLGIVTMATGNVRWFDLSPDYNPFQTTLRWLSDDRLVTIVSADGARPVWLRTDSLPADRLPARWAATRSGDSAAVTVIGSGRFRAAGEQAPESRLMLVDAAAGTATRLASGRFLGLEIAPDHHAVALIERGDAAPLPRDRSVSQIDLPDRQGAAIYDLGHRTLWRPCTDCDILGAPRWAPDSHRLAFFARRYGEDWPDAALFTVDPVRRSLNRVDGCGVSVPIGEYPDGTTRAGFAWRGQDLLLFGRQGAPGRRADWYILPTRGRAEALTAALPDVSATLAAIPGCATAMNARDGLWCLDGRRPRLMFGPDVHVAGGLATGWHLSSGRVIVAGSILPGRSIMIGAANRVERIDGSNGGRLLVVRTVAENGGKALILASPERSAVIASANLHLRDIDPARAIPLPHHLPDGRDVASWLFLPPHVAGGAKLGLVVIPYPGQAYGDEPPAGFGPATARFQASAQILAGHGYAVLLPSLPDSSDAPGTALDFSGGVDRAVDAAIATGAVDPDRIALWGHSYGAYAVATIATRTCRYAAAIASAGIYDLGAVPGIFAPTLRLAPELGIPIGLQFAWAETGQGHLGGPPWADPAHYVSASPAYHADQIMTPMLIIAADRDVAPLQQAEQLFSALFRQNKDAELITYWGEGHAVGSPANVRDLYARVFTWLDQILPLPRTAACRSTESHPGGPAKRVPNAP
jgi:dipeptidyl aminopeptidase/acylaminoacyl peptidase